MSSASIPIAVLIDWPEEARLKLRSKWNGAARRVSGVYAFPACNWALLKITLCGLLRRLRVQ
ncbi:hypothetical protein D3C83_165590 [compost metagenome]